MLTQLGLFLATVALAFIGYYQINKVRAQSNADFILRLNREFFYENEKNRDIIRAIEEHRPLLTADRGSFTEYELNGYLRYFELIERFIAGGIVSFDLVDEMFGRHIGRAWENDEIRKYVNRVRDDKKDKRYFEHFEQLAKKVLAIEKKYQA
jgi:hypothetical protein